VEIKALVPQQDRQVVQSYGKTGFRVSEVAWPGAIIVFPIRTVSWAVGSLADFSVTTFAPIAEARDPPIELLLIGTGQRMALLPSKLRADLRALGFGIEVMDTGAACRTYNVLVGEERRVAAALLPVV
jgi:uncharacterized protein